MSEHKEDLLENMRLLLDGAPALSGGRGVWVPAPAFAELISYASGKKADTPIQPAANLDNPYFSAMRVAAIRTLAREVVTTFMLLHQEALPHFGKEAIQKIADELVGDHEREDHTASLLPMCQMLSPIRTGRQRCALPRGHDGPHWAGQPSGDYVWNDKGADATI